MDRILTFLVGSGDNRIGTGDSFTDKLSSTHTVYLLGIFAIALTTLQWLGEVPIACWCPSHFTDSQVEFTNRACWTQNTYYLSIKEVYIPKTPKGKQYISYYQWVALALTCQAILFYMPRTMWQLISKQSGISVTTVTDACVSYQRAVDPDTRDKVRRYMVKHLGRFLVELARKQLMANRIKRFCMGCYYGNWLVVMYLGVKLMYIGNVLGQILMMNKFLGTDYHMYGFRVLEKMVKGESWSTSDRFPRITLCDLQIRRLGNIHNYTIQCSLPLNLFNEKIYILVWFWFIIVTIATVCSFFQWIWLSVYIPSQVAYIYNRLIALNKLNPEDEYKSINKFVRLFLRRDGIFIIRLVAKNSSDLIAAELICGLYDHYNDNKQIIQKLNSRDEYRLKKREIKNLLQKEISVCNESTLTEVTEIT